MRPALLILLLATIACGDARDRHSSVYAGGEVSRIDAGRGSSCSGDCGGASDGSTPTGGDASDRGGSTDGGAIDGGAIDGGAIDGGSLIDGGVPSADAGPADSGLPPLCYAACSNASDCVQGDTVLQDADNWSCNGDCEYLGCTGSEECRQVFGADYVCILHPGSFLPGCVKACSSAGDCTTASVLFDADNYQCVGGGCRWLGCTSAEECRTAFNDSSYECEPQAGLQFNNCVRPCSDVSECASTLPAYDGDNYACTNRRCIYLGCNNSAECQDSFTPGTWSCH